MNRRNALWLLALIGALSLILILRSVLIPQTGNPAPTEPAAVAPNAISDSASQAPTQATPTPLVFTSEIKERTRRDGATPRPTPVGITEQQYSVYRREFPSISASFHQLVAAGANPEDAARRVAAAAQESIRKQFLAQGETPPEGIVLTVHPDGYVDIGSKTNGAQPTAPSPRR